MAAIAGVEIRSAADGQALELAQLTRLYREAIPASERKPDAALAAMILDPDYRVRLAAAGSEVLGFSITRRCRAERIDLLEYMGVRPDCRSRGIGGRLFERTADALGAGRTLLVEVDSDRVPAADAAQRRRRKSFYRRLGCREVDGLRYRMPIGRAPPAMDLMIFPADRPTVQKALLRRWIACLYAEVYGLDAADPRIDEMLEDLPARVAVT